MASHSDGCRCLCVLCSASRIKSLVVRRQPTKRNILRRNLIHGLVESRRTRAAGDMSDDMQPLSCCIRVQTCLNPKSKAFQFPFPWRQPAASKMSFIAERFVYDNCVIMSVGSGPYRHSYTIRFAKKMYPSLHCGFSFVCVCAIVNSLKRLITNASMTTVK